MGSVVTIALVAVAIFVVLWTLRSTPAQGQKVLQRWGIAKPTEEQGQLAADYLKQRRNLYPYVAIAVVGFVIVCQAVFSLGDDVPWEGVLLASIVASLLVAELVATMRRPTDPKRSATLTPRQFTDIVPRFGLVTLGVLTVLVIGTTIAIIAARPFVEARNAWRDRHLAELQKLDVWEGQLIETSLGPVWFALLAFAICVIASLSVARLCQVRGPLTSDLAVDAALRIRSGRVALGTAVLLAAGLFGSIGGYWQSFGESARPERFFLTDKLMDDYPPIPGWMVPADRLIGWTTVIGLLCLFVWVILISPWRTQRLVAAHV